MVASQSVSNLHKPQNLLTMKTFATLLVVISLFTASNAAAQTTCTGVYDTLQVNLISALLYPQSMWFTGGSAGFNYPKGEPTSTIFAGGIWVTNRTRSGQPAVAIMRYGLAHSRFDYATGPIIEGTLTADSSDVFCRVAKVDRAQVEAYLADFADGTVDNLHPAIEGWPARGNATLNLTATQQDLAPFVDRNSNAIYEPMLGDYPDFRGDQAAWWVINDLTSHDESGTTERAMVEVQVLAEAFAKDADDEPGQSQLYSVRAINRSGEPRDSFSVSLWADFDIGCPDDDLFGSLPDLQTVYAYNADAVDGFIGNSCTGYPAFPGDIPITAIRLLRANVSGVSAPYRTSGMHLIPNPNSPTAVQSGCGTCYFNFAHGRWGNGLPLTVGGDGYQAPGQGTPTNWTYSGNPADTTSWSQCGTAGNETRALLNANLFQPLAPDEALEVEYAVVVVDGISLPCPDSDSIAAEVEKASNHLLTGNTSSSREVRAEAAALSVWPNPSSGRFSITLPAGVKVEQVRVLDAAGRVVEHSLHQSSATSLDVELASKGVFLVSVEDTRGYYRYGKIVVR